MASKVEEDEKNREDGTEDGTEDGPRSITLELGDIIEIESPANVELHQNTFFIIYLDDSKIKIVNVSTFLPILLKLDSEGRITDESIKQINILSKSEEKGYARQHMLLPKTWVNIHFGGEIPTVITGEITNLEVASIYLNFIFVPT